MGTCLVDGSLSLHDIREQLRMDTGVTEKGNVDLGITQAGGAVST